MVTTCVTYSCKKTETQNQMKKVAISFHHFPTDLTKQKI